MLLEVVKVLAEQEPRFCSFASLGAVFCSFVHMLKMLESGLYIVMLLATQGMFACISLKYLSQTKLQVVGPKGQEL